MGHLARRWRGVLRLVVALDPGGTETTCATEETQAHVADLTGLAPSPRELNPLSARTRAAVNA